METLTQPGYKHTELGWIPEEWELKKFEDVLDGFSSGMTPYRAIKDYYRGDIPWITSGELDYGVIYDTNEKITHEAVKRTNLKIIPTGTFLFAITGLEAEGTRGSCAITGIEATTNQSCMALYPKKGKLTTEYLFHYYVRYGNELAFQYCQGTKQQSYTGRIAKKLPIIVPPTIEEQQAIATALSDMDAYIRSLEQLIEKKKAIKQAAMQELLTPKEDWEVRKLGDCLISNPSYGINAPACSYSDYLPVYLRITDISEEGEFLSQGRMSVNHPLSNQYTLEVGDLVVARTGASVGKSYFYDGSDGELVYAGFLIRIKTNKELLNPYFLKCIMNSKEYWNWISIMSMRSGQPGINSQEIRSLEVSLPDLALQNEISDLLFSIDNEIKSIKAKLSKAVMIKQAMMQDLLTGKVRLV